MAVNINYLMEKGLSYYDFTLLQLIAQNTDPKMHEEIIIHMQEENLKRLHALDMLKLVNLKKKADHDYTRLRLSKKGKMVFRNAQIIDYTAADEALLTTLSGVYEGVEKPIGNDERVKQLIAWFRVETQYSRKMLYFAIIFFIGKHEDEKKTKYIPSLENLLWKPNNVFASKWSLADSRLYQFINENKQELNAYTASKKKDK